MNITTSPKNKTLLYCITLIVISYCNGLPLPTTSKTTTRRSSYSSLLYFLPKEQQQSIQTKSIKIPSHTTTKPLATTTKLSSSSIPLTEDFEKDDDDDDDDEIKQNTAIQNGHTDYLNYRRANDPARPMLRSLYGEEWTERLIEGVLFPMLSFSNE
mmetsp:Transcript_7751/g.11341  ORF Transcript_7751/g.11341 Transcript_7751/m.11341 type:complete len:156 (-) Transcript_7751:70-537(-)